LHQKLLDAQDALVGCGQGLNMLKHICVCACFALVIHCCADVSDEYGCIAVSIVTLSDALSAVPSAAAAATPVMLVVADFCLLTAARIIIDELWIHW